MPVNGSKWSPVAHASSLPGSAMRRAGTAVPWWGVPRVVGGSLYMTSLGLVYDGPGQYKTEPGPV